MNVPINIDPIVNHIFDLPWDTSCAALKWYCCSANAYYYGRPREDFSMVEAHSLARAAGCDSLILDDMS